MSNSVNFCFWNLNKQEHLELIIELFKEKEIDIFIFTEITDDFATKIKNKLGITYYEIHPGISLSVKIISKYKQMKFIPFRDTKHYSHRKLTLDSLDQEIDLFLFHLPSKLYKEEEDHHELSMQSIKYINESRFPVRNVKGELDFEQENNVLLLGDFNINPYESGMMNINSFYALPVPIKSQLKKRKYYENYYKPLYNPSWKFYGSKDGPHGTHYYCSSGVKGLKWHMLDQVLMSQGLIDIFDYDSLEIISKIGSNELILNDTIDDTISDHLPLYFKLIKEN